VVVGNPGKIIKQVTDEMLKWKTEGTALYQQLPADCFDSLKPCKPRRKPVAAMIRELPGYQSWKKKNS
jgi:hypothetical protein